MQRQKEKLLNEILLDRVFVMEKELAQKQNAIEELRRIIQEKDKLMQEQLQEKGGELDDLRKLTESLVVENRLSCRVVQENDNKLMQKQLQEKEAELDCLRELNQSLIIKEPLSRVDLDDILSELVQGSTRILTGYRDCGIKMMDKINDRPILRACKIKFPAEEAKAYEKAGELVTFWQENLRNLEWYPFRGIEDDKGDYQVAEK